MPVAGGDMKNLTPDWDLIPDAATWNRDYVYFGAAVGGDTHLFRVPAGGGRVERITQGDRSLGSFSFSEAFDRMAYTATDAMHPAEVFVARTKGDGEAGLSALDQPGLNDVQLSHTDGIPS